MSWTCISRWLKYSLKKEMDEIRLRKADLVKKEDIEKMIKTLKENLHHVYKKFNEMYKHISKFTATDWKAEGKLEEYKLIESIYHVTSKMMEKGKK